MTDFMHDWKTSISLFTPKKSSSVRSWCHPPPSVLKLNFEGSSFGNPGPSGFGCVVRDSDGKIVMTVAGPIGVADSTKAEAMGLLMGLREIRDLHSCDSLVEGDTVVVVS